MAVGQFASARVDARRNRERLLAAARELLASDGVDVPVREIAQRAGVGVGTLYLHFPRREDLVDAVLEDAFDGYVALAEAALAESDAWTGFTTFVEQVTRHARDAHGMALSYDEALTVARDAKTRSEQEER